MNESLKAAGILTRVREDVRCIRTLTFILSPTGRGKEFLFLNWID
jgi:hypothetical protein